MPCLSACLLVARLHMLLGAASRVHQQGELPAAVGAQHEIRFAMGCRGAAAVMPSPVRLTSVPLTVKVIQIIDDWLLSTGAVAEPSA